MDAHLGLRGRRGQSIFGSAGAITSGAKRSLTQERTVEHVPMTQVTRSLGDQLSAVRNVSHVGARTNR